MYRKPKHLLRAVTATGLAALFAIPQSLVAQAAADHVVSPSDLQSAAVNASQKREQNIATLNAFLTSEQAQKALQSAHMNPVEVKNAVASLSDEELAQLAKRANKAQADFAAGNISDRDLLIILVLIAALILIIVAVH
jgi:hypothetical protein